MRLRVRGPSGATTLNLDATVTVAELKAAITNATDLPNFDIKYGYPPKTLVLPSEATLLTALNVNLEGQQLIITAAENGGHSSAAAARSRGNDPVGIVPAHQGGIASAVTGSMPGTSALAGSSLLPQVLAAREPLASTKPSAARPVPVSTVPSASSGPGALSTSPAPADSSKSLTSTSASQLATPISLSKSQSKKDMAKEVPIIPLPSRGASLVMRVMPDDNSCLFRAFATAVLPMDDDQSMTELRSLVASAIQSAPQTYTAVVLEKTPDDYCRWIQTPDAWGGAIEMGILAQHFEIEICSIDVQSLRVDKFNEGCATRCVLVYSGIHYDVIVQSPSEPPHTTTDMPPEFDRRVFDSKDEELLEKAKELCRCLREQKYFTDTKGMAIECLVPNCGWVGHGENEATAHASQTGHYDMAEAPE